MPLILPLNNFSSLRISSKTNQKRQTQFQGKKSTDYGTKNNELLRELEQYQTISFPEEKETELNDLWQQSEKFDEQATKIAEGAKAPILKKQNKILVQLVVLYKEYVRTLENRKNGYFIN